MVFPNKWAMPISELVKCPIFSGVNLIKSLVESTHGVRKKLTLYLVNVRL